MGKQRVVDAAPLNIPRTTTVLPAIRLDGPCACVTLEGGSFLQHDTLFPALHEGDWVIMDNLTTHHCIDVEPLIRSAGATPLYLPPYSPDFDPIEKMWSKMKSVLCRQRVRVKEDLPFAVFEVLKTISSADCQGWFCCAGY